EAKDRWGNTQTGTSQGQPELLRLVGISTANDPTLDPGPAAASPAAPPPTEVEPKDENTHPAAIASTDPCAQPVMSPRGGGGDNSASQPALEQPSGHAFFETGFGHLIGIVGAVFLGVLTHLIALVLILRRHGAALARVFRVELVNPAAAGFVGQG